jgi:hypothetical protein
MRPELSTKKEEQAVKFDENQAVSNSLPLNINKYSLREVIGFL